MKNELMDFMKWMAINDRKPWENYEQVVDEYLSTKAVNKKCNLHVVNVSDFANKCGSCENLGVWVGSGFDDEDMHLCTQLGATTYVSGRCEYYEKAK